MTRCIVGSMVFAVAMASAYAQPAPAPAPGPPGDQPGPADDTPAPAPPAKPGKDDKIGNNESLQNGGSQRPWAQGVTVTEQRAALQLFHDGNLLLNEGLFAKAADKYREGLKHWDHPAIHYNLALALMNLNQPIEAYDHLTAAVKFGDAPLQSKDKYDHAKDYLLLLGKQIAEVEVSCDKAGATVTLDGKQLFVAPGHYQGRVLVGRHQFLAEKQGYTARITAPYIGPGEHFRIELKLYTAEELTRYRRRWHTTWIPYAVAGGALLLGASAGALEASAQSSYRQYDDQVKTCNQNNAGCPQSSTLKNLRSSGDTKKTLGIVGYSVAGAALVTASVLWYLNRPEAYQIRAEDLQNDKVSVAPVVAPDYAGAAVLGHF